MVLLVSGSSFAQHQSRRTGSLCPSVPRKERGACCRPACNLPAFPFLDSKAFRQPLRRPDCHLRVRHSAGQCSDEVVQNFRLVLGVILCRGVYLLTISNSVLWWRAFEQKVHDPGLVTHAASW